MDSKKLDHMIKAAGAALRDMKTGPGCPGDDRLLNYVYETVSQTEHLKISKHIVGCPRCRFEAMRIEADRAAWEAALDEAPDAALSYALGPKGLARIREISASRTKPGSPQFQPQFSSLEERYRAHIENGLESLRAALESIRETLLWPPATMIAHEEQASYGDQSSTPTAILGEPPPPVPLPDAAGLPYLTLILVRLERKEVVILLKNQEIGKERHIRPDFGKADIGKNRLYLILTFAPLGIDQAEADITPDRLVEIMARAEAMPGHVEVMEMEVLDQRVI